MTLSRKWRRANISGGFMNPVNKQTKKKWMNEGDCEYLNSKPKFRASENVIGQQNELDKNA